ncbi:MAG: PepSY-associated TM helix domain-containing protein [Planctomycetales bacterium]|nr:PepSY-associated TM helix domain-containing protein [Planctomycetales bacterium]
MLETQTSAVPGTRKKRLSSRLASWMRWLHIYSSMLGLATVLFFSVTGITLNHPDWFPNLERSREASGYLSLDLLSAEGDPLKLEIVEWLRNSHHITARLSDFSVDDFQCVVGFAGPGYSADVFIDRQTGKYDMQELSLGIVAVINDLHKGRDTGPIWKVVIDISAILLTFISASGLVLICWLRRKLISGILTMLVGTILIFWASYLAL